VVNFSIKYTNNPRLADNLEFLVRNINLTCKFITPLERALNSGSDSDPMNYIYQISDV